MARSFHIKSAMLLPSTIIQLEKLFQGVQASSTIWNFSIMQNHCWSITSWRYRWKFDWFFIYDFNNVMQLNTWINIKTPSKNYDGNSFWNWKDETLVLKITMQINLLEACSSSLNWFMISLQCWQVCLEEVRLFQSNFSRIFFNISVGRTILIDINSITFIAAILVNFLLSWKAVFLLCLTGNENKQTNNRYKLIMI